MGFKETFDCSTSKEWEASPHPFQKTKVPAVFAKLFSFDGVGEG